MGVKQSDIFTPTLFFIYFAVRVSGGTVRQESSWGRVFHLRRFHTKSKNFKCLIRDLSSADDTDFIAHSKEDLHLIIERFFTICNVLGLRIRRKTKVMFTFPTGMLYKEPIFLKNTTVEGVDLFPNLQSTI